jgi:hypothetical protein
MHFLDLVLSVSGRDFRVQTPYDPLILCLSHSWHADFLYVPFSYASYFYFYFLLKFRRGKPHDVHQDGIHGPINGLW